MLNSSQHAQHPLKIPKRRGLNAPSVANLLVGHEGRGVTLQERFLKRIEHAAFSVGGGGGACEEGIEKTRAVSTPYAEPRPCEGGAHVCPSLSVYRAVHEIPVCSSEPKVSSNVGMELHVRPEAASVISAQPSGSAASGGGEVVEDAGGGAALKRSISLSNAQASG